ncbi:MAG: purine-nucleoside phosphorylase [Clostridia bacterium]|nr:purine-nucleoside phosphorylase [Clostridia bacterium]
MTPHNNAKKGDFAKTVLMPGDPLRAKYIAENFLENPCLVNNVRGIQGYTGTYKGVKVSVMASGMGMPSIGIYSYELFSEYDVENIIRVGSAGGYSEKVKVRDVILAQSACYDTNFASQYCLPGTFSAAADYTLLEQSVQAAREKSDRVHIGAILSSDVFYNDNPSVVSSWQKMGVLAVEMEAAALYMTAARLNKRALAILTVSDHLVTKEETTAEERQTTFNEMIEIALDTAVKMNTI